MNFLCSDLFLHFVPSLLNRLIERSVWSHLAPASLDDGQNRWSRPEYLKNTWKSWFMMIHDSWVYSWVISAISHLWMNIHSSLTEVDYSFANSDPLLGVLGNIEAMANGWFYGMTNLILWNVSESQYIFVSPLELFQGKLQDRPDVMEKNTYCSFLMFPVDFPLNHCIIDVNHGVFTASFGEGRRSQAEACGCFDQLFIRLPDSWVQHFAGNSWGEGWGFFQIGMMWEIRKKMMASGGMERIGWIGRTGWEGWMRMDKDRQGDALGWRSDVKVPTFFGNWQAESYNVIDQCHCCKPPGGCRPDTPKIRQHPTLNRLQKD